MEMRRISGSLDAGVLAAARRLVEQSLAVVRGETLVVVFDRAHEDVATIIADVAAVADATASLLCLESFGVRPHDRLAPAISTAFERAQASILLVDFHAGELDLRSSIVELAARHRLRHGHMVGVGRESMIAGFAIDPYRINEKMRALLTRARPDATITVKSDAGTSLVVTLDPTRRWVEYGNVVGPGKRVNLPGGELVTSPVSVDGTYVADGSLGDADGAFNRRLGPTPLTFRFERGRVVALECARDPSLADALLRRIRRTIDLDRVGTFNFGVNLGLTAPVGEIFTDQKVPGAHLSLGTTFAAKTGADWDAKSWIAVTTASCDVDLDRHAVLRRGHYLI
jgi:leucyl aminopeptidase (aminopeptidase T)